MPDVLFALTGDVRQNSRALRQLHALEDLGRTVEVLALAEHPRTRDFTPNIRFRLLEQPSGSGPLFFWRVHRLFSRHASSISAAVYHASDLYNLPAMHAAANDHDAAVAFDSRELYPHVASAAGRPWVRWFWRTIESTYLPKTDAIFTVNESIARELKTAYDVSPVVLHNVPAFEEVQRSSYLRDITGIDEDRAIILHQGSMQKDRGCEQLVAALEFVEDAALVFLGGGPLLEGLQASVARRDLQNRVYFVPPVPPDELLPVTASADIGVTLLEDTCRNHRLALPNKLFEYLMAGLPVVASELPEIARVVDGFDVGRTVDPGDTPALSAVLQELVDRPKLRASLAANAPGVFEHYSWEKSKDNFVEVYTELLGGDDL